MIEPLKNLKRCERCGTSFKCNADDISNCFCKNMPLPEKAMETINKNFKECLCETCLRYFQDKAY